ncbi:MAG: hypothetical protein HOO96_13495, partial [Polyangiaceae bacterium]|nr:hypothetical protein [Polyangiaceae bacterium]
RAQLVEQEQRAPQVQRNDLCPCGSGLKFKACHGAVLEDDDAPAETDGGSGDAPEEQAARAPSAPAPQETENEEIAAAPRERSRAKLDPEDPCACGSGEKFKDCHGKALADDATA